MSAKRGNGRSPSLNAQLNRLRIKIKKANYLAAKEIEKNVHKFGIIVNAAERDLRKLKGAGKSALRSFRGELKKSWKDLKRVAHQQF
jgi:archaellum component FlaC